MCYSKGHNVDNFHFEKLLMLTSEIISAISERDTLKPLGIQIRPFANSLHEH